MAKKYMDSIPSLASPRDLEYWQKQLGLKPTATPGFYYDDEGNYNKIFGGEDTYKFDLDPRASPKDFDWTYANLKKSKEDKKTDLEMMDATNAAMLKLQAAAAAKGMSIYDPENTKEWVNPLPPGAKPNPDIENAMGHVGEYWYHPKDKMAMVPFHPNLFNWGVNVEEIVAHGDEEKLTNDPMLPHALYTNMYYPGHFEDNYLPEYNWERVKNKGLRGYTLPENDNVMDIIFPESGKFFPPSLMDAHAESNYIANRELSDLQGLGTTGFDIVSEAEDTDVTHNYGSNLLEEMYAKDIVEQDVPLHSWGKDLYDTSRMSYADSFFGQLKQLENDYNKYLAMTGPLRDRSTPIWESEVKNPLFQLKYNTDFPWTQHLKSKNAKSSTYAPWDEVDYVQNPFPEYARWGGPRNFWNEFLKPMSHKQWWAGDKAGSKFQSLDDQQQVAQGNIVSNVNDINEDQMSPYYLDWKQFSDYAPVPNRSGEMYNSNEIWDYLNDPDIDTLIRKLNKK